MIQKLFYSNHVWTKNSEVVEGSTRKKGGKKGNEGENEVYNVNTCKQKTYVQGNKNMCITWMDG